MCERPLRSICKLECVTLESERPIPFVEEEERTAATNHQKILKSVVLKVGKESASGIVQHSDARLFCYVFKGSVAPVTVEPVGQPRRLADIKIVESIVVEVTRGHTVVAVS